MVSTLWSGYFFLFSLSSNGWPTQEKSLENEICSSRNTLFITLLSISNQFSCLISCYIIQLALESYIFPGYYVSFLPHVMPQHSSIMVSSFS